jgi:hypothetical protein
MIVWTDSCQRLRTDADRGGEGVVSDVLASVVPLMTSNSAPSGLASCSSHLPSPDCDAYRAFAALATSGYTKNLGWLTDAASTGYLQYQFSVAVALTQYGMVPWSQDVFPGRAPKTWTFEGANDGTNWTTLDTQIDFTGWIADTPHDFPFTNATAWNEADFNASEFGYKRVAA